MKTRILALHFPQTPKKDALPEIATRLLSLSPRVGIRPPDMVYVDLSPTLHLLGGEKGALQKISGCIAIADDVATAGALARVATSSPIIAAPGESEKALAELSLDALLFLANPLSPPTEKETRAAENLIHILHLLGIQTLGEFARIPASTLGPRFGSLGVELHRRARGLSMLPFEAFTPTRTYRESQSFEFPVSTVEPLIFTAKNLLDRLEAALQKDVCAASELTAFLEMENAEEIEIRTPLYRPLRKTKALLSILKEQLSKVRLEAPAISLSVELSLPVRNRPGQFHLFDTFEENHESLTELLSRLIAKIGPTFVSAAALREKYRPESSWAPEDFDPFQTWKEGKPWIHSPIRPMMLLPSPESIHNKGMRIVPLQGPERLEGEWWEGGKHARDYYVAETQKGQRVWVFKSLKEKTKNEVYLHGYFD